MKRKIHVFIKYFSKNKIIFLILFIFACELFLRLYQMDVKNPFGYDQVDNAWAAKNLIVNHEFPLVGMVAKGNSGVYIGPFYYYLVTLFYWLFGLNPFASGVIAAASGIFSFWTIYFVAKKLFNTGVALIAITLNTFLTTGIIFDRIQWPVSLIPGISILIFYFLYRVVVFKEVKKMIPLAILLGFSLSIHFTSIFFFIIVLLCFPLFPRSGKMMKYFLLSLPLFLIWLVPNIAYQVGNSHANSNFLSYFYTYYHGFHLRRIMQLAGDGLIQFNSYLIFDKFFLFKFIAVPLFFLLFLYKSTNRSKLVFCYLILLWFIVPWFIFSMYSGEISDYYFSINRYLALFIISYIIYRIWIIKSFLSKILVFILFAYLIVVNFNKFLSYKAESGLKKLESKVSEKIRIGEEIKFQQGVPESYIYYYLKRSQVKN